MMTEPRPARDPLLDRLADAWSRHDPPPARLADRMLRVVRDETAADPFEAEYELLVLTSSGDLVGTRSSSGGSLSDPMTLQFTGEAVQLLVRVTPVSDSQCRVDGWITPATDLIVSAVQAGGRTDAVVTAPGRFEFAALDRAPTRLLLSPGPAEGSRFGTASFDL